jgi:hypothetical protein
MSTIVSIASIAAYYRSGRIALSATVAGCDLFVESIAGVRVRI